MSDFYSPNTVDPLFNAKPKKAGREAKLIDAPAITYPIRLADTHAHINMLSLAPVKIARAGFYGVKFIECMTDPLSEEGLFFFDEADSLFEQANKILLNFTGGSPNNEFTDGVKVPNYGISVGVHPHYAKNYTDEIAILLKDKLSLPITNALGEIGLDYHYDFSPRDAQVDVFERQLQIAQDMHTRVILHIREAFDDAFAILKNFKLFGNVPVLLHCYTSDEKEIVRWVNEGCYVAFGGAITFSSSDNIRNALIRVPRNRLLIETDAPFMAPVPFRGVECESAHMIYTIAKMMEVLGIVKNEQEQFYDDLLNNAYEFFGVENG